jgi:hypothetical protein
MHPGIIENTDFTTYIPVKTALDEIDELKNLYHKYEGQKIASFTD